MRILSYEEKLFNYIPISKMKKVVLFFAVAVAAMFASCGNEAPKSECQNADSTVAAVVDSAAVEVIDSAATAVVDSAAAIVDSAATEVVEAAAEVVEAAQ